MLLPSVLSFILLCSYISASEAAPDHSKVVKLRRQDFDAKKYPKALQTPPRSSLPKDWVQALEDLQNQGKIPNIPLSKATKDGVKYPGHAGHSKETCSWTTIKCFGENDVQKAPDGSWIISFDDGPTAVSPGLYDFLHQHEQPGTHFMIGSQILAFPDAFKHAMQTSQQPAVHTWSHSLQSSKDNYEILGELGWTMQIIYDLSGRVPKYWRPPQGDIDNRVRAIAEQVFNLTAVMWDDECNDWCLHPNGSSDCPGEIPGKDRASVVDAVNKALAKPKSPGAILLEHELNNQTVSVFEDYYPTLPSRGWKPMSVPDALGVNWYQNAVNNDDTPIKVSSMLFSTSQSEVEKENGTSTQASSTHNKASNSGSSNNKTISQDSQSGSLPRHETSLALSTLLVLTIVFAFLN